MYTRNFARVAKLSFAIRVSQRLTNCVQPRRLVRTKVKMITTYILKLLLNHRIKECFKRGKELKKFIFGGSSAVECGFSIGGLEQ